MSYVNEPSPGDPGTSRRSAQQISMPLSAPVRRLAGAAWELPWSLSALAVRGLIGWQRRLESRSQLAAMDAHRLRDIGITEDQRDREVAKPFWRR